MCDSNYYLSNALFHFFPVYSPHWKLTKLSLCCMSVFVTVLLFGDEEFKRLSNSHNYLYSVHVFLHLCWIREAEIEILVLPAIEPPMEKKSACSKRLVFHFKSTSNF